MKELPIRVEKSDFHDIFCARPSIYSNPYKLGRDGTRKEILEKYKHYLTTIPNFGEYIKELEGKRLACWCSLFETCHVDALISEIIKFNKQNLFDENSSSF